MLEKEIVELITKTVGIRRSYTFGHLYEVCEIMLDAMTVDDAKDED